MNRRDLMMLGAAWSTAVLTGVARAQSKYPQRPIRLVVPFAPGGIADLVGGQIPMMTVNVTGQLLDLHRSGKIRILAVTSPARLKGAPDIPTAVEAGLPDMIAQLFTGLFVAAATPPPIIEQIAQA